MRRFALPAITLVIALAAARPAQGQARDPAAAEALFRDARTAMKRGDYASACAKLEESGRLDPAAGTLLNLAECEEHVHKLASAWQHLHQVLDMLPAGDDRFTMATQRADALAPHVPKLLVRLAAGASPETRVRKDDIELGSAALATPLPLDPGTHTITASAPGHAARKYSVTLAADQSMELLVEAGDPERAATEPRAASAPAGGGGAGRTLGFVAMGVGGAALAVGAITGILAIQKNNFMNAHCDAGRICDQDALDAGSSGRTFSTVSTVSFIAGGVLVAGGLYWIFTHPAARATAQVDSLRVEF